MLTRGHPAGADGQGKCVCTDLNRLARILGRNHPRERPTHRCVARWKRSVEFVMACTMAPESSPAITFVGTLAIRGQLQPLYDEQSVCDGFFSQAPRLGEVIIMSCQSQQIERTASSH